MFQSLIQSAEKIAGSISGQEKQTVIIKESERAPSLGSVVIFQLFPFKDNELGVSHWHSFLKNFSGIKEEIQFYVVGNSANIKIYILIPQKLKTYFQNMFFAAYNTSDLVLVKKGLPLSSGFNYVHFDKKAEIATKDYFVQDGSYIDPMRDLFSMFTSIPKESTLTMCFKYKFKETTSLFKKTLDLAKKGADLARNGTKKDEKDEKKKSDDGDEDKVVEYKQNTKEVFLAMGYSLGGSDEYTAQAVKNNIEKGYNTFVQKGKLKLKNKPDYCAMSRSQAVNFFHVPTKINFVKGLEYAVYRKLPYPGHVPTFENSDRKDITILGKTDYKGEHHKFGIRGEDKMRHVYVVGKTGTGKSTFLSNMIKSDVVAGKGVCLIDPHGDLVDTVLEHIPSYRNNDVILFDIGDSQYPIGFNLLQYKSQDEKLRIVSGVVGVFHKMFGHSRGPRLEYILRNVLLTIVDYPNATILHIMRVLVDKNFREEVLAHLQDSVIMNFRRNEFDKRQDRQVQDAIGPITNKVGQFLSSSLVRNIFGQPQANLNIREAMDSGKIILVNLSKGKIGDDNAKMIGSLLVTKIQIDAMSRADMHRTERTDFMLYIDEFQNFATDAFAEILSEARKYRLSLIVANQFTAQLQENVRDAIFGNVGTMISFTLGRDDAEMMAKQYKEMIDPNDLLSLPKFKAYTKLMIDGVMSDPFSMQTLPLPTPDASEDIKAKIRKQSRQRYAMERSRVEGLLRAWAQKKFSKQEAIAEKAMLEGLGLSVFQIESYKDPGVQTRLRLFLDYAIDGNEPDEILFDIEKGDHKVIWYQKPDGFASVTIPDAKRTKGQEYVKDDGEFIYDVKVEMYEHKEILSEDQDYLDIWIGSPEEVRDQLENGFKKKEKRKHVPNIDKRKARKSEADAKRGSDALPPQALSGFTIKDIKIGEEYEGYVKLLYNYGIFVTVKGVEGLLHKNRIVVPEGLKFKNYYNIGDKILVKAMEYKEVNGEKKVVRTQK